MRTNRSFFVYVIVHCSNGRHVILCCHLQEAEFRSGDGAERQPSPQLVLYVSSAAPPHNRGQQRCDRPCTVQFIVCSKKLWVCITRKQWGGVPRCLDNGAGCLFKKKVQM